MKKHEFTISISSEVLEKSIKNLNNINEIKIFLRIIHLIYQKQNLNTETFELSLDEISNDPVTLNNGRTLGNSEKTGYGEYFKRK